MGDRQCILGIVLLLFFALILATVRPGDDDVARYGK